MQRLLALILVGWLNAYLLAPALLSPAALQLPQCCRRTGIHKCAMQGERAGIAAQSPSEALLTATCPFSKVAHPKAVLPISWLPAPTQIFSGQLRAHPAAQPQTEARFRCSLLRSRQKRGPPSLLA
jgi:hypothetical protein